MTEKIQVGPDVWIRPNNGMEMPKNGDAYYQVLADGSGSWETWRDDAIDFAFYQIGNCFPTLEAAEAAIVKPVDPTPITYRQWNGRGRPSVYTVDTLGCVCELVFTLPPSVVFFDSCNCWFTHEAAQAWIDEWYAEAGVMK